ncbi:MAG: zinc ribbon domain-containing protein [Phototrophicales bacterium]|nr:zinc ribbon domain-containing protein [Phototrophicales bacterium]
MPNYDYKCQSCGNRFSLFYKTYADYDTASKNCPNCGGEYLSRLITHVAIQQPTREYGKMNSHEMLSVLQSGDSRQVGEMFTQIGGADPRLGAEYHDTAQRLLKGDSIQNVERDLQAKSTPPKSDLMP